MTPSMTPTEAEQRAVEQLRQSFGKLEQRLDVLEEQSRTGHDAVMAQLSRIGRVVLEGDKDLGMEGLAFMVKSHERRLEEHGQRWGEQARINLTVQKNREDIDELMRLRDRLTWTLIGLGLNGAGLVAILLKLFGVH